MQDKEHKQFIRDLRKRFGPNFNKCKKCGKHMMVWSNLERTYIGVQCTPCQRNKVLLDTRIRSRCERVVEV